LIPIPLSYTRGPHIHRSRIRSDHVPRGIGVGHARHRKKDQLRFSSIRLLWLDLVGFNDDYGYYSFGEGDYLK